MYRERSLPVSYKANWSFQIQNKEKEVVLDTISCDFAGLCLGVYKGKLHRIMERQTLRCWSVSREGQRSW